MAKRGSGKAGERPPVRRHAAGRPAAERPPVRRHAAERPPVRRPLLVTGCGPCWLQAPSRGPAQWPGPATRDTGRPGGGPCQPPGCLRCGPLPSADCWPSALSRGCDRGSHPVPIICGRPPRDASLARVKGGSARSARRLSRLTGREAGARTRGKVQLSGAREFTPARTERGSGNGRPNEGRGAVSQAGESGLRDQTSGR